MLEDGIHTLAFGHHTIPVRIVDDDPDVQRVYLTQTEAFYRGLGGQPGEGELPTQPQTQTPTRESTRFQKRKACGRVQLAMDVADDAISLFENASDESQTDVDDESESDNLVDYDSNSENDGIQGRSTSSRSHPFILSHCTVRKRKGNRNTSTRNVKHSSPSISCSSSSAPKRKRVQILSESDSD